MKNRLILCLLPTALAGMMITTLHADDSTPPPPQLSLQDQATQSWLLEQTASIAKDPETAGIWAVDQAADMLKEQQPQTAADYFQRMLYQAKGRGVQRAIRFQLVSIYRAMNREDKATEQLEELMTDSGEQ
jgi:thioredoxin-like negative regulator of GroEL